MTNYQQGFELGVREGREGFASARNWFRTSHLVLPEGIIERHAFITGYAAGLTHVIHERLPEVHEAQRTEGLHRGREVCQALTDV